MDIFKRIARRVTRRLSPVKKQSPAAAAVAKAQTLAAAGDWAAAAAVWQSVAQDVEREDPETAAIAYSEHGRCRLEQGRLAEAQSSLQRAKTIQPGLILAWRLLGWVAAKREDWPLAAAHWRAVLKTEPPPSEQTEALVALSRALTEMQDFTAAAAAIDRLDTAADDPLAAEEQRALLAEKQGDHTAAASHWLKIAAARGDDHSAWTAHARFCYYLGEFGAAKTSLERVFALAPDFIPARQILGRIATEQRDWPLSAEQWRAILRADLGPPELAETLYALGGALIEMDEFDEAATTIERLGEVETDKRDSLELRAAMAEKKGEWEAAGKLWLDIALLSG